MKLNEIDQETKNKICTKLNVLLANYQVFLSSVKGYLWNIKDPDAGPLLELLLQLKSHLKLKVTSIEDMIVSFDKIPPHRLDGYVLVSEIKAPRVVDNPKLACQDIVLTFEAILKKHRMISRMGKEFSVPELTQTMMDYILEQEDVMLGFAKLMR